MSKDKKHHQKHGSLRVSWDGTVIAGVDRVSPLVRSVEVITVREGSSPAGAGSCASVTSWSRELGWGLRSMK